MGRVENLPAEVEFVRGSVADDSSLEAATRDVEIVCHEAARVTIRGSVDRFYEDAETNLMGTLRLLQWCGKRKVRRFVYASSMAVYADAADATPVDENHPV